MVWKLWRTEVMLHEVYVTTSSKQLHKLRKNQQSKSIKASVFGLDNCFHLFKVTSRIVQCNEITELRKHRRTFWNDNFLAVETPTRKVHSAYYILWFLSFKAFAFSSFKHKLSANVKIFKHYPFYLINVIFWTTVSSVPYSSYFVFGTYFS